jgi:hypothetical protein
MTERHPPLTIEEYATVLAYLAHYAGAPRVDVFLRLEVNEVEWQEADEGLSNAMIQELLEEQRALSDAFNGAFVPVKRRLKKEMPELASVLPLRPPLAVAPPAAAVSAPPEPVFAPPAAVVAPPAPVFAPPAFIFAPPAPVVSDRDALVPVGMRHFKSLKGTEAAADPAPAPALPFRPSLPGEPSALAGSEPRSLVPAGMRGFTSLSGTQGASPLPASPALPFAGTKGPPPAPPPPAPPPPVAVRPPLELPSFSTEQYASLCVELELDPAGAAETLQRYRLTAEQRIALDAAWRERMARAPDLYAAWSQATSRYKAWKLQQPRR